MIIFDQFPIPFEYVPITVLTLGIIIFIDIIIIWIINKLNKKKKKNREKE